MTPCRRAATCARIDAMPCDVRACYREPMPAATRGPLSVELVGIVADQVREVARARRVPAAVIISEACERMCCDGATVAEPMG
jgi:hypothetical protein